MTEDEARRLCLDALSTDEKRAYEVIYFADTPIQDDKLAVEELEDIVAARAARRLDEADRFPLGRHELGGVKR